MWRRRRFRSTAWRAAGCVGCGAHCMSHRGRAGRADLCCCLVLCSRAFTSRSLSLESGTSNFRSISSPAGAAATPVTPFPVPPAPLTLDTAFAAPPSPVPVTCASFLALGGAKQTSIRALRHWYTFSAEPSRTTWQRTGVEGVGAAGAVGRQGGGRHASNQPRLTFVGGSLSLTARSFSFLFGTWMRTLESAESFRMTMPFVPMIR